MLIWRLVSWGTFLRTSVCKTRKQVVIKTQSKTHGMGLKTIFYMLKNYYTPHGFEVTWFVVTALRSLARINRASKVNQKV